MEDILGVVFGAVVLGLFWKFKPPEPPAPKEVDGDTIFGGVAKTRNGRIVNGQLVIEIDELKISVEARIFTDESGERWGGLRWSVELPRPGTTTFKIYPEGARTFASKMFGGQDVELNVHPSFDYTFMIKANDPVALRRMWRIEQCALLMEISRDAIVSGKDQMIVLEAQMRNDAPDLIEAGIDLMIALGRTDLYGVRVLRALPDAKPMPDSLVKLPGPGEIRVGLHRDGDRVKTRVWSQIRVDRKVAVPDELGSARLDSDGVETTLTWDGIEEEPQRLLEGVAFLRSLSEAPALGVFR